MIPCYVKRSDVEAMANERAVLRAVMERCGPIALPYYTTDDAGTIHLIEYTSNLSTALRLGHVDPCGSVVGKVVDCVRDYCDRMYNAGITHYDLHTSNVVLKWLGADLLSPPDTRLIDFALSKDYASGERRPLHVRVLPEPDAEYDWFFFCFSLMQAYKLLGMPLPAQVAEQRDEILDFKDRMEAAGHEWARVEAKKVG